MGAIDFNLLPELGNEHFEYLYRVFRDRLHEVYHSLKLRAENCWLGLSETLYSRKHPDGTVKPFTVEDMHSFICRTLFTLEHHHTIGLLDVSIKDRKYEVFLASPVTPRHPDDVFAPIEHLPSPHSREKYDALKGFNQNYEPNDLWIRIKRKYLISECPQQLAERAVAVSPTLSGPAHQTVHTISVPKVTKEQKEDQQQPNAKAETKAGIEFIRCSPASTKSVNEEDQDEDEIHPTAPLCTLACQCQMNCDCRYICVFYPDMCICYVRREPLGPSPKRNGDKQGSNAAQQHTDDPKSHFYDDSSEYQDTTGITIAATIDSDANIETHIERDSVDNLKLPDTDDADASAEHNVESDDTTQKNLDLKPVPGYRKHDTVDDPYNADESANAYDTEEAEESDGSHSSCLVAPLNIMWPVRSSSMPTKTLVETKAEEASSSFKLSIPRLVVKTHGSPSFSADTPTKGTQRKHRSSISVSSIPQLNIKTPIKAAQREGASALTTSSSRLNIKTSTKVAEHDHNSSPATLPAAQTIIKTAAKVGSLEPNKYSSSITSSAARYAFKKPVPAVETEPEKRGSSTSSSPSLFDAKISTKAGLSEQDSLFVKLAADRFEAKPRTEVVDPELRKASHALFHLPLGLYDVRKPAKVSRIQTDDVSSATLSPAKKPTQFAEQKKDSSSYLNLPFAHPDLNKSIRNVESDTKQDNIPLKLSAARYDPNSPSKTSELKTEVGQLKSPAGLRASPSTVKIVKALRTLSPGSRLSKRWSATRESILSITEFLGVKPALSTSTPKTSTYKAEAIEFEPTSSSKLRPSSVPASFDPFKRDSDATLVSTLFESKPVVPKSGSMDWEPVTTTMFKPGDVPPIPPRNPKRLQNMHRSPKATFRTLTPIPGTPAEFDRSLEDKPTQTTVNEYENERVTQKKQAKHHSSPPSSATAARFLTKPDESPLKRIGNFFSYLESKPLPPKPSTDSDLVDASARIPFEGNRNFGSVSLHQVQVVWPAQSPQSGKTARARRIPEPLQLSGSGEAPTLAPAKTPVKKHCRDRHGHVRYISAGGNDPVYERGEVSAPFKSPERIGFTMSKDELLERLPFHKVAQNLNKTGIKLADDGSLTPRNKDSEVGLKRRNTTIESPLEKVKRFGGFWGSMGSRH